MDILEKAMEDTLKGKEEEIKQIKGNAELLVNENLAITPSFKDNTDSVEYRLLYALDEGYTLFISEDDVTNQIPWKWGINPKELADKQDSDEEDINNRIILLDNAIKSSIAKSAHVSTIDPEVEGIRRNLLNSLRDLVNDENREQRIKIIKEINNDSILNYLREVSDKLDVILTDKLGFEIMTTLKKHKQPSAKELADYLNNSGEFFLDSSTRKRYKKAEKGFEEVTLDDLTLYFNNHFGNNQISENKLSSVLSFITRPIKTDYDLVTFQNGTLNTETEEFMPEKFYDDRLTKLTLPFKYVEEAEDKYFATPLSDEIHAILKPVRRGWEWNEELFYKCLGSSFTAYNEIDKLTVIVGKPKTRKTTLLSIIKHVFKDSYSEVKLQTIAANERFKLIPTLRKAVNIDDDLQGFRIEEIGFLNSFVSGAGGTIELKGENIPAKLTAETTPRIWGASNKLPSIQGEGFQRRLCLILAENDFKKAEDDKGYIKTILKGERDDEISLLVSYAIQLYFKNRHKPITSEEQDEQMLNEWEWKSYPAKKGAEYMFIDTDTFIENLEASDKVIMNIDDSDRWILKYDLFVDGEVQQEEQPTFVSVKEVNKQFKRFHIWARKSGRIFKEQARPSTKTIKTAMSNAGFDQAHRKYEEDYKTKSERVYEDCILSEVWVNTLKYDKVK